MPARKTYDVAVVGAGPAGVAAAAAAADVGVDRVVLIESTSRLGGSVSAAMHRCLCGLYSCQPQDPLDTLNAGGQREVIANMVRRDPAAVVTRQLGKTWVLEFPSTAWEASLTQLGASGNIDRLMNSRMARVRRDDGRIVALQVERAVSDWIEVGAVIDCTGGGALLQMAGPDVTLPADDGVGRMLGGFSIRLTGLTGNLEMLRLQTPYALSQGVAKGILPREARFTMFHPGPDDGEGTCKLAVDPKRFSDAGVGLFAERVIQYLRDEIPGFSAARVVEMSPRALPRDGSRLRGEVVVTEDDVMHARKYGDGAVHAWWPVERWDANDGPSYAYPPEGQHYDIPGEALRSASVKNLFAAGMCVSATAGAAASLRASGICLATGDAAGRLAAAEIP